MTVSCFRDPPEQWPATLSHLCHNPSAAFFNFIDPFSELGIFVYQFFWIVHASSSLRTWSVVPCCRLFVCSRSLEEPERHLIALSCVNDLNEWGGRFIRSFERIFRSYPSGFLTCFWKLWPCRHFSKASFVFNIFSPSTSSLHLLRSKSIKDFFPGSNLSLVFDVPRRSSRPLSSEAFSCIYSFLMVLLSSGSASASVMPQSSAYLQSVSFMWVVYLDQSLFLEWTTKNERRSL